VPHVGAWWADAGWDFDAAGLAAWAGLTRIRLERGEVRALLAMARRLRLERAREGGPENPYGLEPAEVREMMLRLEPDRG